MSFPPNLVPGFVADTTTTSGAGTLTLDDSPPTGYRSFVDAFSAGDLVSGDEVTFATWDSTVSFPGNQFEIATGIWTNSGGGGTLTRATTHQPNGTPVSWPASGTRNVLIIPDGLQRRQNLADIDNAATARTNLGVPGLAAPNIFFAAQTVQGASEAQWRLDNTTAVRVWYLRLSTDGRLRIRDNTAAKEPVTIDGGGSGSVKIDTSYSLTDSAGLAYEKFPGGGVTKLLFGSAIPAGWTRANETNPSIIRLATSGDTIGATGGSADIFTSWTTNGHTLVEGELPSHLHGALLIKKVGAGGTLASTAAGTAWDTANTSTAGSDTPHSHNMTTPRYRIAAWATKD